MIQGYSRAQTQSIYKKANNKAGFKPPGSCNNKKETYFGFTVNNKTNNKKNQRHTVRISPAYGDVQEIQTAKEDTYFYFRLWVLYWKQTLNVVPSHLWPS